MSKTQRRSSNRTARSRLRAGSPERAVEELGLRLRELRQRRQLTMEMLAESAGLSYKFVGEIERGIGNPTLTTMMALADALDCDLSTLIAPEREPRRTLTVAQIDRIEAALRELLSAFRALRR